MQTFLPSEDFGLSARVLDRQRLGKQRVEVKQILNALTFQSKGWTNHPATKMWRGHERALIHYGMVVCQTWIDRGYNDSIKPWLVDLLRQHPEYDRQPYPNWLGDIDFHLSHQSNLIRKLPEHYGPLFPGVPDDLPYLWPIN